MKLLTFQARHFGWAAFSKALESAPDPGPAQKVKEVVVAFMHLESSDQGEAERKRTFKHTLKHLKWLANKRDMTRVVLHSFTHLGGDNADPEFALDFMKDLRSRLQGTGYEVWITPFGYSCEWDLSTYGESLAKVWKAI
ncbi:MAG: hypothetical protein ACI9WU_000639 [Myxococcota bacterium]